MTRFGAVLTAMVTPFDDVGRLDTAAAAALARWLVANGSDGLVLAGSTGEGSVLTDDEDVELVEAVRAAVTCPIIVGSSTNDTAHSVELTGRLSALGIDGILAVTPYYNRPPQRGVEEHFRAVADATDLPVMLYDIPVRTGRKIATDTLLRLADVSNIVALKDAAGDPQETARLIAQLPADFEVYSGDDALTLPLLSVGAVGVVSVASHWDGVRTSEMIAAYVAGDVERARRLNQDLLASYAFESSDEYPNPLPTKALLRALGLSVGQCRLPLGVAPESLDTLARQFVEERSIRGVTVDD